MSTRLEFIKKVAVIQQKLKAPKGQLNKFAGYNYRNQEDILEAVKPLLGDLVLTVNDEMVEVGGRIYVKATSTITDGEYTITNSAFARESEDKKGMDSSQLTGATSSYARKYSLNGLFLIDDTKDADSMDNSGKERTESPVVRKETPIAKVETKIVETPVAAAPVQRGGSFRRRGQQ